MDGLQSGARGSVATFASSGAHCVTNGHVPTSRPSSRSHRIATFTQRAFALRSVILGKAKDVKSFQLPSNKSAAVSELTPDLSSIKLIDYDFKKYGSSEERTRLLKKWDEEVGSLPQ